MKIMKGCLLTVSAGILGILTLGGVTFLLTDDSRLAAIAGLLGGTLTPILGAFTIWVFNHNYWAEAVNEIRDRLGKSHI